MNNKISYLVDNILNYIDEIDRVKAGINFALGGKYLYINLTFKIKTSNAINLTTNLPQ